VAGATCIMVAALVASPAEALVGSYVCDEMVKAAKNTAIDLFNLVTSLEGQEITVALYSGELASCDDKTNVKLTGNTDRCEKFGVTALPYTRSPSSNPWTGYDIRLLERIQRLGKFDMIVKSMGQYADVKENFGDFTKAAKKMLGEQKCDLMGQGTWRVNEDRAKWAVWSNPTVTTEVQFLTRGPEPATPSSRDVALLFLRPFDGEAWAAIIVTVVGIILMLSLIYVFGCGDSEDREEEEEEVVPGSISETMVGVGPRKQMTSSAAQVDEVADLHMVADIPFLVCMGCAQEHIISGPSRLVKGLLVGWVLFAFFLGAIYTADLAAILTQGVDEVQELTGMADCIKEGCTFCTVEGAANDNYFRKSYSRAEAPKLEAGDLEPQIKSMSTIKAQIECVLDRTCTCDAAEITREDLYKWSKGQPELKKCKVQLIGNPIVKRPRGMMSTLENQCTMMAIDAMFHELAIQGDADVDQLLARHFPTYTCSDEDKSAEPLEAKDVYIVFIIPVVAISIGFIVIVVLLCSKKNRKKFLQLCCCMPCSGTKLCARGVETVDKSGLEITSQKSLKDQLEIADVMEWDFSVASDFEIMPDKSQTQLWRMAAKCLRRDRMLEDDEKTVANRDVELRFPSFDTGLQRNLGSGVVREIKAVDGTWQYSTKQTKPTLLDAADCDALTVAIDWGKHRTTLPSGGIAVFDRVSQNLFHSSKTITGMVLGSSKYGDNTLNTTVTIQSRIPKHASARRVSSVAGMNRPKSRGGRRGRTGSKVGPALTAVPF